MSLRSQQGSAAQSQALGNYPESPATAREEAAERTAWPTPPHGPTMSGSFAFIFVSAMRFRPSMP
jgi:hypothetical protein